jgi:phosphate transport system substrate-binding protein
MEQMKRIFRGEYKNWEEVGGADEPIRVLAMRPQRSDFAKMFELWALEWMHFRKDADFQDSFQDMIRNVSTAKDEPIGFVPYSQLIRSRYLYSVKVLALKRCDNCPAIKPPPEAFNSLRDPIGIPLYLYWNGKTPSDMVRNFVGFCAARAEKWQAARARVPVRQGQTPLMDSP